MKHWKGLAGMGLIFLLVLLSHAVGAEPTCQWVEAKGEASLEHVTAEEARQLALRGARARAVEQVAGIELQSQVLIRNAVLAGQFLRSLAHGYVLREEVVRWEQGTFQEAPEKPLQTLYRVHLRACVSPQTAARDPYFTVRADLNKTTFVAGEKASLRIQCMRDCYLAIFNLAEDDSVHLLLPNAYQPSELLKADQELTFPRPGLALEMVTLPGHARDTEAFLVVATKQPFDFRTVIGKTEAISILELSGALLQLVPSERAEVLLVYEVRNR